MHAFDCLKALERIHSSNPYAIMATMDAQGQPRQRWMSPVILPGRGHSILAVTAQDSRKVAELKMHSQASWMFQSQDLHEVLELRGGVRASRDPELIRKAIAALGDHLNTLWDLGTDPQGLIVLETLVESFTYLRSGQKSSIQGSMEPKQSGEIRV